MESEAFAHDDFPAVAFAILEDEWPSDDLDSLVDLSRSRMPADQIRQELGLRKSFFTETVLKSAIKHLRAEWKNSGLA